jgi:uncharacterized membrane protein
VKTGLASILAAFAGLAGCSVVSTNHAENGVPGEFESASISGIYDDPIRLDRGRYEGEPFVVGGASRPTVTMLPEPRALVDIDGDGDREWLVILAESSGGSGTFIYLTMLEEDHDGFRSRATVLLGDRVRVAKVSVDGSTVGVDLIAAGKDDPACCPTELRTRRWKWIDNALHPVSRFAGNLVYGHEARELVACDGRRYWVADETGGDLRQSYEASITTPYQPLFAEVEAIRLPAPDAAFAAPYDETLHVTNLRRLETEGFGCSLELGGAQYRAFGVEPFWQVDVEPYSLQFSRIGQPLRTLTISNRQPVDSGQTWLAEGDGQSLALTVTNERCTNPMSGSVFAYTAKLNFAGETLAGCALTPLPAGDN